MKNLIFTFLCITLFIGNTFGQNEKTRKWSVEIGGVYNQWHQVYNIQNGSTDTTLFGRWAKLRVMPSLRINRQFQLSESVYLKPFIGASVSGTQSDISFSPLSASDFLLGNRPVRAASLAYYYLPQIEVGTFADAVFRKSNLQLGIKAQYHLTLWTNHTYTYIPFPLTLTNLDQIENRKYTLDDIFHRFNRLYSKMVS
ncbi:MAG: hypothetical protein AB8G11_16625 [Saprospiraceae bacterium]